MQKVCIAMKTFCNLQFSDNGKCSLSVYFHFDNGDKCSRMNPPKSNARNRRTPPGTEPDARRKKEDTPSGIPSSFSRMRGFCCYEIFMLRLKLAMALLGIIDHAALADHIHLDLTGIFQFSFDLLGDIAGEQYHVGI